MDSMKKAWTILKTTDFQRFLVEVFGIPRAEAKKLAPSQSLRQSISRGKLTEFITENEFEQIINLVESEQYETLLRALEQINSRYTQPSEKGKRDTLYRKERYANDPEYRERRKQYQRGRNRTPEYKERRNQRRRERYANDPEYRRRENERRNQRYRERYANDPEFRRRENERRDSRRKKNKEES